MTGNGRVVVQTKDGDEGTMHRHRLGTLVRQPAVFNTQATKLCITVSHTQYAEECASKHYLIAGLGDEFDIVIGKLCATVEI